jgi:hypothetical protein
VPFEPEDREIPGMGGRRSASLHNDDRARYLNFERGSKLSIASRNDAPATLDTGTNTQE